MWCWNKEHEQEGYATRPDRIQCLAAISTEGTNKYRLIKPVRYWSFQAIPTGAEVTLFVTERTLEVLPGA